VQQRLNRFKDASISAGILGHVWMNIGRFDEARKVVLEAVCFAKRCQDCLQLVTKLSILSQIYHYMGQNGRAFAAYKCGMQKQERMPMIRDDPEFPVLNCLSVYNYSELLLSLKMVETLSVHVHNALDILSQSRDKAHTLANALMRLTLGRISMVQGNFEEAELHLNSAVDQFKAAGRGDDRARVLLARADVSRANLNFDRWEADLLLALDAANRCEAGTCQADCHLAMAWLRLQQKRQKLAVRHYRYAVSMCVHGTSGYHRKDAEIVELKAALKDST
jgi:tetratricopeptide (TPR) repeat protein